MVGALIVDGRQGGWTGQKQSSRTVLFSYTYFWGTQTLPLLEKSLGKESGLEGYFEHTDKEGCSRKL